MTVEIHQMHKWLTVETFNCFIVFVNFQESQMMMMELRTVRRCFGTVASGMITSVMSSSELCVNTDVRLFTEN